MWEQNQITTQLGVLEQGGTLCKNKEPTVVAGSLLISGCSGFNQKPVP